MKRSPMKPGSKGLKRTPMPRGDSVLKSKAPMQRASKPMKAVGARARRTGQGKVVPSAAERAWMGQVAAFGCVVCWRQHGARTPCAVHHILAGGRRMGHLFTIGLCDPGHHQGGDRVLKISRHPDKARFEQAYGTELELLDYLRAALASGNMLAL